MDDDDDALSAHIRHLLLDYVHCHLTIDHIQYTQLAVSELLPLSPVPIQDPRSLTLSTDPYTQLCMLLDIQNVPQYDEKLTTTHDARLLLKDVITSFKGTPKSERLVWSTGDDDDEHLYYIEPILTRRAVHETPVLGSKCPSKVPGVDAKSYSAFMTLHPVALTPVSVQAVKEPEVKMQQVLDVTYQLREAEHTAVRAILKSVSAMCRPPPPQPADEYNHRRLYLPPSMHAAPPRTLTPPPDSPPLLPIFPRKAPTGIEKKTSTSGKDGKRPRELASMADLPQFIVAPRTPERAPLSRFLEEEATDASSIIARQNMVIVDGWQTYATSSPSTLSTASSDDEIDQLLPGGGGMRTSSPDTDVSGSFSFVVKGSEGTKHLTRDIERSKLEVVQIPRARRIGGSFVPEPGSSTLSGVSIGKNMGLGHFLKPLLIPEYEPSPSPGVDASVSKTVEPHALLTRHMKSLQRTTNYVSGERHDKEREGQSIAHVLDKEPAETEDALIKSVLDAPSVTRPVDIDIDSMDGQASANSGPSDKSIPDIVAYGEDGDEEIRHLYQTAITTTDELRTGGDSGGIRLGGDPKDFIRDERLFDDDDDEDGKGQGTKEHDGGLKLRLMPVPVLPAPNTYTRPFSLVSGLAGYVHASASSIPASASLSDESIGQPYPPLPPHLRFLKKAKGIASLRVSLSWVPFTVATPLPTQTRLLGIEAFVPGSGQGEEEQAVHALLERACASKSQNEGGETEGRNEEIRWRGGSRDGHAWKKVEKEEAFSPEVARCEIILTRAERRGLGRLKGLGASGDIGGEEDGGGAEGEDESDEEGRGAVIVESKTKDDRGVVDGGENGADVEREDETDDEKENRTTAVYSKKRDREETTAGILGSGTLLDEVDPAWDGYRESEQREADLENATIFRPAKRSRMDINMDDSGIGMMTLDRDMDYRYDTGCDYGDDMLQEAHDVLDMLTDNNENADVFTDSYLGYYDNGENKQDHCDMELTPERSRGSFTHATHEELTRPDTFLFADNTEEPPLEGGFRDDFAAEEQNYDDTGGSFEPLSLSYDSQAYQAFYARPPQTQHTQDPQEKDGDAFQEDGSEIDFGILSSRDGSQRWRTIDESNDPDGGRNASRRNEDTEPHEDESTGISTMPLLKNLDLDLATHALGIDKFAKLRAKSIKPRPLPELSPLPSSGLSSSARKSSLLPGPGQPQQQDEPPTPRITPQELYDRKTVRLSASRTLPSKPHKYMASLDVLQKQVLVRCLRASECLVELVERDSLGGVDLIVDPYTAVVFAPLLSLPAQHKALLARLSAQTWRYSQLLIIFEAYPVSRSSKSGSRRKYGIPIAELDLYAYTPPIVKALKKFRRDLDIAEACGTKAPACDVCFAFADRVDEAAAYARLFGDRAEENDRTGGAIWGDREWLDLDMSEDEEDLAAVRGMNRLSASILLCQVNFQEILEMSPEERTKSFEPFIGLGAVKMFNDDLEQRMRTIDPSEDPYEHVDNDKY